MYKASSKSAAGQIRKIKLRPLIMRELTMELTSWYANSWGRRTCLLHRLHRRVSDDLQQRCKGGEQQHEEVISLRNASGSNVIGYSDAKRRCPNTMREAGSS